MSRNLYTPVRDGCVQSTYADQMESAYAGQLANASDFNLTDSYLVSHGVDPDGLVAGVGVVEKDVGAPTRPGVNESSVGYPAAGATADDFEGVMVRAAQMGTNSAGKPCMWGGEMCNVLRKARIGGRIWVMLSAGTTAKKGAAHWIVSDTGGHGHQVGSFSAVSLGADTVELPFMCFMGAFTAPADGYVAAKVEIVPA